MAIDFDFEAPGIHYKFGVVQDLDSPNFLGGAVPYLLATADGAASPPPLLGHMISVNTSSNERGGIWLMPSGLAPRKIYWEVLKKLGDKLRLDSSSGEGLMALLDLRARFADEVRPDYLLIDARTGVTDLGGLATTILADTVVCMFVANQESIDGTLAVVKAIKSAPRLAEQKPIRIVPVLSRAMESDTGFARSAAGFLNVDEVFVLPHDDLAASGKLGPLSPLFNAYK
ncbi:MAG: hypothetical protein ABSC93_10010 [Bryobacteraceae bacterium]